MLSSFPMGYCKIHRNAHAKHPGNHRFLEMWEYRETVDGGRWTGDGETGDGETGDGETGRRGDGETGDGLGSGILGAVFNEIF
ncbi:MAG: hypothetical protein KIPDCIKN_01364 [Haliscomenobacter sp.]|nr:hypothetical protein [Haliscomenobacter sp.]